MKSFEESESLSSYPDYDEEEPNRFGDNLNFFLIFKFYLLNPKGDALDI